MQVRRMFGLDVFRSIAILLVVFSHGMQLLPDFPALADVLNIFSYLGVELFFVLSGFLIGRILIQTLTPESNFKDVTTFWKRRWWRTLPNYYLFLIINLIGFGLFKSDFQFDPAYVFFVQNLYQPNEGFFSVSWSLAVEEWFYLTTPLIFLVYLKLFKQQVTAFFITCATVLILSSIARWVVIGAGDATWNDDMRRIVILRLDSLMYGVLVAWLWLHFSVRLVRYKHILAVSACIFLALSIWLRNQSNINQSPAMLFSIFPLASIGSALFLPLFADWYSTAERSVYSSFVTKTSLWSYSIYLVHVPLLEIYRLTFFSALAQSALLQVLGFSLWLVLSYVASYLIFRFFENPMTNLRDHNIGFTDWRMLAVKLGGKNSAKG